MVGSSAFSSEIIPLYGLTPPQFLVIAVEIVQELGWQIDYLSDASLIAFADPPPMGREIKIILKIDRFTAKLRITSADPEHQDVIAGQKAIVTFLLALHSANRAYRVGELEDQYEALKAHLSPPDDSRLGEDTSAFKEGWQEFLSVFTPGKGYFVTPLLILFNTAIFISIIVVAQLSEQETESIIRLGANSRADALKGEVWRLVSSVFFHWDIMHLFMNMLTLYFIGAALEPRMNSGKFAVVYLSTGVLAGITNLGWHVQAVSAGASGAVFGLYGVLLAWLTTNLLEPELRKSLLPGMILFIGYGLLGGTKGNIDNAAHIGGLLSGIVIGFCLYPGLKKKAKRSNRPS